MDTSLSTIDGSTSPLLKEDTLLALEGNSTLIEDTFTGGSAQAIVSGGLSISFNLWQSNGVGCLNNSTPGMGDFGMVQSLCRAIPDL